MQRANCYFALGRWKEAAADFEAACQGPQPSCDWAGLFLSRARLGKGDAAREQLRAYLRTSTEPLQDLSGKLNLDLLAVRYLSGALDEGAYLAHFAHSRTSWERTARADAYFKVAQVQILAGRTEEARKLLEVAASTGDRTDIVASRAELSRLDRARGTAVETGTTATAESRRGF
jgi:tetratricopeptide (TPR) repeat protein